jgi:HTH-type transcriptional regulator, quorum sensing regulator NprR
MVKSATAERYAKTHVDELAADVGQRIRAARQERGMSLADLGGEDLSRSFLSLVELGRSRISLRALAIVAERLELPLSYFLGTEGSAGAVATELTLDQAEGALAQQEPEECLRHLRSLELREPVPPRALMLEGRALTDLGRPRDALGVLQKALSAGERRTDTHMIAEVSYLIGVALYSAGNYDEALVYLRRSLDETSRGPEDPTLLGKITVCIGHILYVRGDTGGAIEQYARARDLFGSVADLNTLACVYSGLSLAYKRMGDQSNALRYSKLSVSAFEAKQNARQAARELNNLAIRYRELGDLEQAVASAIQSVERGKQIEAPEVEALARSTLASLYLKLGQIDGAVAEAEAAIALSTDDTDLARVDGWIVLAEVAERNGDRKRADQLYRKSLDILRESGHQTAWADAALGYSLVLRERGETEPALEFAVQAAQARAARTA